MKVRLITIILVGGLIGAGCTVIFAYKTGNLDLSEKDSHDAGTNAKTIDFNLEPK